MDEAENRAYIQSKVHPILEKLLVELLLSKPDDPVEFIYDYLSKQRRLETIQSHRTLPQIDVNITDLQNALDPSPTELDIPKLKPAKMFIKSPTTFNNDEQLPKRPEKKAGTIVKKSPADPAPKPSAFNITPRQVQSHVQFEQTEKVAIPQIVQSQVTPQVQSSIQTHIDFYQQQGFIQKSNGILADKVKVSHFANEYEEMIILERQPSEVKVKEFHHHLTISSHNSRNDSEIEDADFRPKISKQMRQGISAEVLPNIDFKIRNIPKTTAIKNKLEQILQQIFLFSTLDSSIQQILINAMQEKKVQQNEWIIKQGDDGDNLYIVDEGILNCYKNNVIIKTYKSGSMFGELALLYNIKRSASIQAQTNCQLWALDKETFNHVVRDHSIKKRAQYENFLDQVDILQSVDKYERLQIADSLKEKQYKFGETVVTQGEMGHTFYIVKSGKLKVIKDQQLQVFEFKENDYFGELALIKDQPRQATVICESDCALLCLDRQTFKRLLGPIENILNRNAERYNVILNPKS